MKKRLPTWPADKPLPRDEEAFSEVVMAHDMSEVMRKHGVRLGRHGKLPRLPDPAGFVFAEPPQLTPDGRKLVSALTAMELQIDELGGFLASQTSSGAIALGAALRQRWAGLLCDITTAQALLVVTKKLPRVPGRLRGQGTRQGTDRVRKKKT